MNGIILRHAEKEDAPILHDLLQKLSASLGKKEDFHGTVAAIEKFGFAHPPAFEAIIAFQDETPLGFILFFYEFSTWRGLPGIYVQDLFVLSHARGLGLGEKLTSAAVTQGAHRKASYMRLSVHAGNDLGIKFYKAMGFEVITDETMFLLEGDAFDNKIVKGL